MSNQDEHALLSPSGSFKWLNCPGSLAMERGIEDEANKYSDEGTCAHSVAAMCLTENMPASAYIGRRIEVGPCRTYEFSEDMAEPVQDYVDLILSKMEAYRSAGAEADLFVEVKVPIGQITGEADAYGTADAVVIATWASGFAIVDVTDLKFGQGVSVYAEENPQAMMYALGALEKFSAVYNLDQAEGQITIHQPRKSKVPSVWECKLSELRGFEAHAKDRAFHALQVYKNEKPEALQHHLRPGDHCRKSFCKARATCPALAKYVEQAVGADFKVLTPVANISKLDVESVSAFKEDFLSTKMSAITLIEDWCKQIRAEVERRLLTGADVPGYKLVRGRQGNRAWSDAGEAEAMLKSMRLKVDQMYDFKLISPTAAEKILKATPKRWAKAEALITRREGGLSVAPTEDKREAHVVTPLIDEFEVVKQEECLV